MAKSPLIRQFKALRLTDYEARCYLALLEKHTMTVSEVSQVSGVPRANAYDALRSLAREGLCVSRPGKSRKYTASDPNLLKEKFLEEIEGRFNVELKELSGRREQVQEARKREQENLNRLVAELIPLYQTQRTNDGPLEYIEVLQNPLQVHKKFLELFQGARKEVLGFCKPPYLSRDKVDEQDEIQRELVRGGLKVRAIYEIPADEGERHELYREIEDSTKWGEETRVIRRLPLKMVIFDDRMVQIALVDPVRGEISVTSLVVDHPDLARTLKIVFEMFWEISDDYRTLLSDAKGVRS